MNRKRLTFVFIFLIVLALAAGLFSYDPLWQKISHARPWKLGLDLAGGSFLTYEIDLSEVGASDRESVVRGLRDVIERRVNLFGVSEPRVYIEKSGEKSRLVVELAGIKDVTEAIRQIGETPFLDFREVKENGTSTPQFLKTELSGRYVRGASLGFDNLTGGSQVFLEFNDEGGKIFADLTEKNVGRPLAIFLDDELIEMPIVQEKISGGKAQITGRFTLDEARGIVERFNAGALPAPVKIVNQQTIGADFGSDALKKAIVAGIIGTIIVMIFMMLYYRGRGVIASIALLMYIAFVLAIFKIVPVTLTLAGIAGFILSIGMAVDANILVFERTKEELKKGLSRSSAVEEGFRRAWTSIRDSNVSTLITSAVLYYFTSSFVRGFALTLFIGVIVSMFSAITVTRTILRIFTKQ
ncbi:MAG: protein translocase subunit SecD [Patescibacteria group bacterium]